MTAFIIVTIAIIQLNSIYNNIFEFDFSEVVLPPDPHEFVSEVDKQNFEYIKDYFDNEFRSKFLDSIKANTLVKIDTVYQEILKDAALADSIKKLQNELSTLRTQALQKDTTNNVIVNKNIIDEQWAKKTAKLIESMNPKNAAKVIQNYSDNEARELIYKMKQSKAAAILSHLDPNFVNRITKSQI